MIEPRPNPLHLYRALLRECTYLPDSRSRTFFHNHTISSFRRYLPKLRSWREQLPLERQVRLLDRGRKELSMLRRANEGYLKPLEKVLMITYGRLGKRRRQLMAELMHAEPSGSDRELAAPPTIKLYAKDWKPPAVVQALMRSQLAHQGQLERSGSRRVKLKLELPEKTIWRKDLPSCRVKNATKRWYARNADLIYPPLPAKEWFELRTKATGTALWSGPIRRRTRIEGQCIDRDPVVNPEVLLEGPGKGETFAKYVDGRPHQITRRLMQRLWAMVFKHTPMVVMDNTEGRLRVQWEQVEKPSPSVVVPNERRINMLFGS